MTSKPWILGILICLFVTACNRERPPMRNTEEYSKAHGIVPGQSNEIRVRGVLFRFPAEYLPIPYTDGKTIVKGQTDKVLVSFFSRSMQVIPNHAPSTFDWHAVRVEI